jgi:choline kinase
MRLIILAAGQGFKLDGFNKLLIRNPKTGKTILEHYLELFAGYRVTVVVGFRAIEVMSAYPQLDYVYNDDWRITGNSYSLALTLNEEPCVVISSDFIFDETLVSLIERSPEDCAFVLHSENKGLNTLRCKVENGIIASIYLGSEAGTDPEAVGIFKICTPDQLRKWKRECLQNKNVFAGSNLPLDKKVVAVDVTCVFLQEINTPLDYLKLIKH